MTHSLLSATVAVVGLASACTPSASFTISVDLGGFNLDSEVKALEDAACTDATDARCAVLSTLAGVPWSVDAGPATRPSLPGSFARTVTVPTFEQEVDVEHWYVDLSQERIDEALGPCAPSAENDEAVAGCSFGRRRRVELGDINAGTIDPALIADAVIERAVVVRDENDSLELPPFELFTGHEGQEPTLLATSEPFDVGGVAVLQTDADAMVMLSESMAAEGGFVEMGTIDDAVPGLVEAEDGSLRRPAGVMQLSLVLHLRMPLTSLAGAVAGP
jgi:hypothetical protein